MCREIVLLYVQNVVFIDNITVLRVFIMNKINIELKRFSALNVYNIVLNILLKNGVRKDISEYTARGLWQTSLRGVDSHGIRLLPHYIEVLKAGRLNPNPKFIFEQTSPSTGILDADNTFGHAAGIVAVQHSINLAKKTGTGFVSVRKSSHCGAMAYYALEASKCDMIGLAASHATPRVKTPGSSREFFGANPFCFTAPMEREDPFCFDTSLTPFPFNKIKQYREDDKVLPAGCAADKDGQETNDPHKAAQLLPIADYKGFGLIMMVDILCSLLSGMPGGKEVSAMYGNSPSEKRNLGHFFGAMRIDVFSNTQEFKKRLQSLVDDVRQEPKITENSVIQVAGDPEKQNEKDRKENGIPIKDLDLKRINILAEEVGLKPLI